MARVREVWPSSYDPGTGRVALCGRDLRYAALVVLWEHGRRMSLAEIVGAIERRGFAIEGRTPPGKTLADALRWEIRRVRVYRRGRGVYVIGDLPPTTRRRAQERLRWLSLRTDFRDRG